MAKAIFTDLDGTLLNNNHKYSTLTKKTILKLQKEGVYVVVNTGRLAIDSIRQAKKLKAHKFAGYAIGNNGTQIYSFKTKEFILNLIFTISTVEKIYNYADKLRNIHFYGQNTTYAFSYGTNSQYWAKIMKAKYKIIDSTTDFDEPISRALLICYKDLTEEQSQAFEQEIIKHFNEIDVIRYNNYLFELTPKDGNKGSALEFLSNHLNIAIKDTISFGDSYNDVSLIKKAGIGVAVGNALGIIKEIATDHSLTNYEHGPAKYLQKYFWNK